jgi:SAM-dependent methyltransferase
MSVDHWNQHAQQWQWIASPLRPAREDIQFAECELHDWYETVKPAAPAALLLGVTPEIALMQWPTGTQLTAIDRSQAMISGVWPAALKGATVQCGDWAALPLADDSQHIVIGDGCFVVLEYPTAWQATLREVRRVLRTDGIFIMRFFLRPLITETVVAVIGDLLAARIGNFHVFKWRLAMALHGTLEQGVCLADVWHAWHAAVPDAQALAARLGWPLESVRTIDNYRDVASRYTFPTLAEARAILAPLFLETACHFPNYELGDRCPTLVCRPR